LKKIRLGKIHADYLTMEIALNKIVDLAKDKKGGYIVTPNVDHIVISEKNKQLQSAYKEASLSLADGKPLIWMSKFINKPLPEKISGSDLVRPLLIRAAKEGLKVYFLGSAPGVAITAAKILKNEIPKLKIVGVDSPPMNFEKSEILEKETLEKMLSSNPDIVLMALGAPKQELLMHKWKKLGVLHIMIGVGASLDFVAGKIKRAPKWISNIGFEWLYRLFQDPGRLIKRYLIQDLAIFKIFFNMLKTPKNDRVYYND